MASKLPARENRIAEAGRRRAVEHSRFVERLECVGGEHLGHL